jgi:hypothetical protein
MDLRRISSARCFRFMEHLILEDNRAGSTSETYEKRHDLPYAVRQPLISAKLTRSEQQDDFIDLNSDTDKKRPCPVILSPITRSLLLQKPATAVLSLSCGLGVSLLYIRSHTVYQCILQSITSTQSKPYSRASCPRTKSTEETGLDSNQT